MSEEGSCGLAQATNIAQSWPAGWLLLLLLVCENAKTALCCSHPDLIRQQRRRGMHQQKSKSKRDV
jgi:hypothetical protein